MARVYHRDQAGAPALTYNTNPTARTHYDALKMILKACLVYGYGTTPPAGWELIYEAADSLILRTGTHSGYVCFLRNSGSHAVEVWLAATYEGVDAEGKIIGAGVRSGVSGSSSLPQRFPVATLAYHTASTTWALVADEGTVVMSLSGHLNTGPTEVTSSSVGNQSYANFTLYCGDDSAGDLICIGGVNTTSTTPAVSFSSAGFTALKYPDSGLLVDTGAISVLTPGLFTTPSYHPNLGDVVLPAAHLQPMSWLSNRVSRLLRGIAVDVRLSHAHNSHVSQALGGPPLTTRTMHTLLDLGDGHGYLVGRSYPGHSISMLLTTNPEFW